MKEWKIIWVCLSTALLIPAVLPFFITDKTLLDVSSLCMMPHDECILCGATRAYLFCAENGWKTAWELNRLACVLYFISWASMAVTLTFAFTFLAQKMRYFLRWRKLR